MTPMLAFLLAPSALAWPSADVWVTASDGDGAIVEAVDDADPAYDLVGSLQWTGDPTSLWIAFEVASPPGTRDDGDHAYTLTFDTKASVYVGARDEVRTTAGAELVAGAIVRRLAVVDAVRFELRLSRAALQDGDGGDPTRFGLRAGTVGTAPATEDAFGCLGCVDPDDVVLPGADSDDDGVPDAVEQAAGIVDTDTDGDEDQLDTDSDDDRRADGVEGVDDADADGVPNFRDDDSDGDGLLDLIEKDKDGDEDGLPEWLDPDSDNDTVPDGVEGLGDFDEDGVPNYLDPDSDGDEVLDQDEAGKDLDCDGRDDRLDRIADDGFCDTNIPMGGVDDSDFGGQPAPPDALQPGDFDGLPVPEEPAPEGCATTPAPGWWLWLLAGVAWRRRGVTAPGPGAHRRGGRARSAGVPHRPGRAGGSAAR